MTRRKSIGDLGERWTMSLLEKAGFQSVHDLNVACRYKRFIKCSLPWRRKVTKYSEAQTPDAQTAALAKVWLIKISQVGGVSKSSLGALLDLRLENLAPFFLVLVNPMAPRGPVISQIRFRPERRASVCHLSEVPAGVGRQCLDCTINFSLNVRSQRHARGGVSDRHPQDFQIHHCLLPYRFCHPQGEL